MIIFIIKYDQINYIIRIKNKEKDFEIKENKNEILDIQEDNKEKNENIINIENKEINT